MATFFLSLLFFRNTFFFYARLICKELHASIKHKHFFCIMCRNFVLSGVKRGRSVEILLYIEYSLRPTVHCGDDIQFGEVAALIFL